MISRQLLMELCPFAKPQYIDSFDASQAWLERTGVVQTPLRAAHFFAQVIHASDRLHFEVEGMWFTAREASERWPRLFPTAGDALHIAGNERALAEAIYGGRIGNIAGTDDAYRYRARGLFRVVGRKNYETLGAMIGVDLGADPALVISKEWAVACAVTIWNLRSGSGAADVDDSMMVTRRIGGSVDAAEARLELTRQLKAEFGR